MGFEWSPWALAALGDVAPYEVNQALQGSWPRPAAGGPAGLRVLTFWGRTRAGRPLLIAARRVDEWSWLIIGAREMTPSERAEFAIWEAQRDE
jgi:hypothetical protein